MPSRKYKVEHSGCPFAFAAEAFGDKWTILILRDVLLFGKKHFDDLLAMHEGIATNILSARLKEMESCGLLVKTEDPDNRRRFIYTPTDKALDLLPAMVAIVEWSSRYDPDTVVTPEQLASFRADPAKAIRDLRAMFS